MREVAQDWFEDNGLMPAGGNGQRRRGGVAPAVKAPPIAPIFALRAVDSPCLTRDNGPVNQPHRPRRPTVNQIATGTFIARKRKEANLTQAQLAERLGISSKSVSKWERGQCMPDYAVVNELCSALGITVSELLDGEENERENLRMYDNGQMIEMFARVQRLENQRVTIIAIALIVMGLGLFALSSLLGGSDVTDFVSGVLFGIGVGATLIGIFLIARSVFAYLTHSD